MEAGGKEEEEEETLQTAFKKLRVDAESVPAGAAGAPEASRAAPRAGLEGGGAKAKLGCPKDAWHGCMRKPSRGASRSQRRRRSKSPILHPPKFTYCSSAALSPPGGCLKHQRLAAPEPDPRPAAAAAAVQVELRSAGVPEPLPPLVFGSCAGYETRVGGVVSSPPSLRDVTAPREQAGASPGEEDAPRRPDEPADFRALSELRGGGVGGASSSCGCSQSGERRGWNGVEVYSFTGLRDVISECESGLPAQRDASRTVSANAAAAAAAASLASGSPRSCSEQARGYVDDITIEDLSGYMEYYLYIPKKMSHMAEMMYT